MLSEGVGVVRTVQLVKSATVEKIVGLNAVALAVSFEAEYAGKLFDRQIVLRLGNGEIIEASDPNRLFLEKGLHQERRWVIALVPLSPVESNNGRQYCVRQNLSNHATASVSGKIVGKVKWSSQSSDWVLDVDHGTVLLAQDPRFENALQEGKWVSVENGLMVVVKVKEK